MNIKDDKRIAVEVIKAKGHPNVKALHKTTIEITKENFLTKRGDCIIGISADKSAVELSDDFKEIALCSNSLIILILIIDRLIDVVVAEGSKDLTLKSDTSIVIRKSKYIDDRTIALNANKAARDINREIINELKRGKSLLALLIAIKR